MLWFLPCDKWLWTKASAKCPKCKCKYKWKQENTSLQVMIKSFHYRWVGACLKLSGCSIWLYGPSRELFSSVRTQRKHGRQWQLWVMFSTELKCCHQSLPADSYVVGQCVLLMSVTASLISLLWGLFAHSCEVWQQTIRGYSVYTVMAVQTETLTFTPVTAGCL